MIVDFHKGINILVGENNSGKTAIIDALRICFCYGNQWRDIGVRKSDFYLDKDNPEVECEPIEFDLSFCIETEEEIGWYNDLLVQHEDGCQSLEFHFKYHIEERNGVEKVRYKVWGGENEGRTITPEVFELIHLIYLGALRDAESCLRPVRGNQLGELFANLTSDIHGNPINEERRQELAGRVKTTLSEDQEWTDLIKHGKTKVNEHLLASMIKGKEQIVDIDFLPFEFRRLVDNLRIEIPVYKPTLLQGDVTKQKYFRLSQNGLGYNNLIYIATILGDLINKKQAVEPESYFSLLIEEPEAHLHPQLQNILFAYLNQLNQHAIQIFITSHSPTITAKADIDTLNVLQNQDNHIDVLSLKASNLSPDNKKYLSKFLDVTKSQLFFSNGTILVEGISEALLIPVFSRKMGNNGEYDTEKAGIEIVNINGVAFEHFGKLYNADDRRKRLNSRCAIITDDDRDFETDEIASRAQQAKSLEGGLLKTFLAQVTFEYELFITGQNRDVLLKIFQEMHPRAAQNITPGNSIEEHGQSFLEKVVSNKAKSELAHRLAILLETDQELSCQFTIPQYIQHAITWVTQGI
jgi:putative ATP-dependent endonuclease of OLD family